MEVGGYGHAPAALLLGKTAGTHNTGGAKLQFLLALLKMYYNMFRPELSIMW